MPTKHILFVTGAFVTTDCWSNWIPYFEAKGYTCAAPSWPGKKASAAQMRAEHPDKAVAAIRIKDVIDNYARVAQAMPEPPVIIGHSFGGCMTQVLINRGIGACGVAIHSVPPQGVLTLAWSFFRSLWGPLGFFTPVDKPFLMSQAQWNYAFANGQTLAEQVASYNAITAPESKRASRDGLTSAVHVDFKKPHAPLLLIGGSTDHIMPASLNRTNFKHYKQDNGSVTEYKEFAGHNHNVLGIQDWRSVADHVAGWIATHGG
ncbi:MAG TPA: alpha/beta hydrolase [Flavobacteriales bacterium]|jgi:pimeloyl-ACP methyl ester carboxylesterase|nr:alpha/beta hydrolase [Flavobacteriales bacterium]